MNSVKAPAIVIVGMGPVGMTAALSLAKMGLEITVLEAGAELASESRASTFHPPSLEILDELGVVEELLELGLKAPSFQYRGHNRELIAHLDMALLSEDTRFPFRVQCEQSKLTRIILRHLEKMPNVTLRFNASVVRAERGTDCVNLYLASDDFTPSYKADWVIAADGASSPIRRSLGIAFEGVTYPERFLVASTTHDFADDFDDLAYVSYVYDPDDWGVLLRTPSHWRVLFPIEADESNEEARAPERIEQRLQGVIALDGPYPVVHSTIYAVHQRLAATFATGRIFLAGDAAHINNPLGGMGMNSGIHDAHAAVQAILYAVEGGDPDRAVDTYARVRRDAAAVDVQKNTQKNYDEMRERDSSQRLGRTSEMADIAADPIRARTYLRSTSMIASFETSRRRMARGLSPRHSTAIAPAGQELSDVLRDGVVVAAPVGQSAQVGYLPRAGVPANTDELLFLTQGADQPLIAQLDVDLNDVKKVALAVKRLERGGVSGVHITEQADACVESVAAAVRAALSVRRDMLLLVSLASGQDIQGAIARSATYVSAGADLIGFVDVVETSQLQAIHAAVPQVPLVLIKKTGTATPEHELLTLAGVGLLLETADATALV